MDNEYSIDEDDDDEVFLHEVDIDGEWGRANAEQSVPKPSFVKDFVDNEDMYANSDEEQHLRRAPQSDEESTGRRFPEFNPSCDIGTVEFESEKYRIRAICVAENCPFEIYASKMQHEDTLQVKRLDPKHTCSRVWENKKVRSSWLAQTFVEEVKTNPTVPVVSLKATIQRNINSGISLSKVRRAKNKALKILEGSISAQYARLWDYATELRNTNPGTTVQIKCDFNALLQMPVFQRMYICLGACKEGFKARCKPVIGLDGI
ncbi:unnamed protein product [Prunus armeniaca]|uniref:Transposase MuDR plant domain-containing protein n=1 Tax=Prunus armeniaca TaxID=36596 RepID=A0A6J5VEJ1_PRUAR|nr:unnamed protein product [Prunus armeniaca]